MSGSSHDETIPPQQHSPLRILSLDGGGIKGYTSLLILKRVFRQLGQISPNGTEPQPYEIFDLFVGTSTGGLIATMLGRLRMSIDECLKQYEVIGREVFGKSLFGGSFGKIARGMTGKPFYDLKRLQSVIKDAIKEKKNIPVGENFCAENTTGTHVMLCVTRVQSKKSDVLRAYKTYAASEENYDCQIWEAASATAAAPIYFEQVKFERHGESWCDGGLRRNNPINEALAEANRHETFNDREVGCVLSIGTGVSKISALSSNLASFLRQSVEMMTDAEETADQFAMSKLGQSMAKNKQYFRFSVPHGLQELEMDEWKEIEKMKAMASLYLRSADCAIAVDECARSLLAPGNIRKQSINELRHLLPFRRSMHFVQRSAYVEALNEYFAFDGTPKRYVLWGTGGVGKTQIALDFAHLRVASCSVFWIRSDQYATFSQDLSQVLCLLRPGLNIREHDIAKTETLNQARRALEKCERFLLILDNADNLDDFLGSTLNANLRPFLPKNGDILITTRDPRFLGLYVSASQGIRVQPMDDAEASELLTKSIPLHLSKPANKNLILDLTSELGNLPLALAQAASNIRELQISLERYIDLYQNKRDRMLLMQEPVRDGEIGDSFIKQQSILVTWELSFDHLESTAPDSAYCLKAMSMLHWSHIPYTLLSHFPPLKEKSEVELHLITKRLLHLSLIDEDSDGDGPTQYSLHPLVHERVFQRLLGNHRSLFEELLSSALASMAALFPFLSTDSHIQTDFEFRRARYLIPHALHQVSVSYDFDFASKACAGLLQCLARFFKVSQLTRLAVETSKRAVDMSNQVSEEGDLSRLFIRKTYAECLCANASYTESRKQGLACLDMLELLSIKDKLGQENLKCEKLDILGYLSQTTFGLGDHAEQECFIQRQIAAAMEFGCDHRDIRMFRHNIASNLANQGRLEEAKNLNQALLEEVSEDFDWKSTHMRFFMNMQTLKLRISEQISFRNASQDEKKLLISSNLQLHREILDYGLDHEGLQNLDTWISANNLLDSLLRHGDTKSYDESIDVAANILILALRTQVVIEGQFLENFRFFMKFVYYILAVVVPIKVTVKDLGQRLHRLERVFEKFLKSQDLSAENIEDDGNVDFCDSIAVNLQRNGQFAEAERKHRCALKLIQNRNADQDVEAGIHYNIMLALSHQSGRLEDAWRYRSQHYALISKAEAIYGDFETNLQTFRLEDELYNEAKARAASGSLNQDDMWYIEHEVELISAQRRLGWLDLSWMNDMSG